ncbi:hypothetical protein QUA54_31875 [Microcoleus sp. MOSTC5]
MTGIFVGWGKPAAIRTPQESGHGAVPFPYNYSGDDYIRGRAMSIILG